MCIGFEIIVNRNLSLKRYVSNDGEVMMSPSSVKRQHVNWIQFYRKDFWRGPGCLMNSSETNLHCCEGMRRRDPKCYKFSDQPRSSQDLKLRLQSLACAMENQPDPWVVDNLASHNCLNSWVGESLGGLQSCLGHRSHQD